MTRSVVHNTSIVHRCVLPMPLIAGSKLRDRTSSVFAKEESRPSSRRGSPTIANPSTSASFLQTRQFSPSIYLRRFSHCCTDHYVCSSLTRCSCAAAMPPGFPPRLGTYLCPSKAGYSSQQVFLLLRWLMTILCSSSADMPRRSPRLLSFTDKKAPM